MPIYYATLPEPNSSHDECERFESLQELANWIADGWDVEHPVIESAEQMQAWLSSLVPGCVLHTVS